MMLKFGTVVLIAMISAPAMAKDQSQSYGGCADDALSTLFNLRYGPDASKLSDSDKAAVDKRITDTQARLDTCNAQAYDQMGDCPGTSEYSEAAKEASKDCGDIKSAHGGDCATMFRQCDVNALNGNPATDSSRDGLCPIFASEDYDKFKEDADKQKTKREKAQDKVDQLTDDINKINADAAETKRKTNTEIRKSNVDFQKDMADRTKEAAQNDRELTDSIMKLRTDVSKNEDQKAQVGADRVKAMADLNSALNDIDDACQEKATAIIAKMQEGVVSKMITGRYLRGSGMDMFKFKGQTDENYWSSIENRLIRRCQADPLTQRKISRANQVNTANKARLDAQEKSSDRAGKDLMDQMNALKSNLPCVAVDSVACQNARTAAAIIASETAAHNGDIQGLQQDLQATDSTTAVSVDAKKKILTKANANLAQEEMDSTSLDQLLAAKKAAGGGPGDDGSIGKAYAAYKLQKAQAQIVLSCAVKDVDDKGKPKGCTGSCEAAAKFLRNSVSTSSDSTDFNRLADSLHIQEAATIRAPAASGSSNNSDGDGTTGN